jgi:hypothetical protein
MARSPRMPGEFWISPVKPQQIDMVDEIFTLISRRTYDHRAVDHGHRLAHI